MRYPGVGPRHQRRPRSHRRATPPRPAAYFGVTEYQLAREKLEQDMQRDGFTVYIIADMEGLAGGGAERDRDAPGEPRRHRRSTSGSARS